MADEHRTYTQEEVNAILRRALEKQESSSGLAHRDLLEAAKEVGIEPASLEHAIAETDRERAALALREEWQLEQKRALRTALITWAWVSLLVASIDLLTAGGPWFQWVLIPWGLVLFLRALRLRQGPTPEQLARIERRRRRQERHRELQRQLERGATLLGTAVEQGAQLLIEKLEEKRRLGGPGRQSEELPQPPAGRPPRRP